MKSPKQKSVKCKLSKSRKNEVEVFHISFIKRENNCVIEFRICLPGQLNSSMYLNTCSTQWVLREWKQELEPAYEIHWLQEALCGAL